MASRRETWTTRMTFSFLAPGRDRRWQRHEFDIDVPETKVTEDGRHYADMAGDVVAFHAEDAHMSVPYRVEDGRFWRRSSEARRDLRGHTPRFYNQNAANLLLGGTLLGTRHLPAVATTLDRQGRAVPLPFAPFIGIPDLDAEREFYHDRARSIANDISFRSGELEYASFQPFALSSWKVATTGRTTSFGPMPVEVDHLHDWRQAVTRQSYDWPMPTSPNVVGFENDLIDEDNRDILGLGYFGGGFAGVPELPPARLSTVDFVASHGLRFFVSMLERDPRRNDLDWPIRNVSDILTGPRMDTYVPRGIAGDVREAIRAYDTIGRPAPDALTSGNLAAELASTILDGRGRFKDIGKTGFAPRVCKTFLAAWNDVFHSLASDTPHLDTDSPAPRL